MGRAFSPWSIGGVGRVGLRLDPDHESNGKSNGKKQQQR
jgi:hypothetical protein